MPRYELNIHQGWDVTNKESEEKVWKERYAEYTERPKSKCPGLGSNEQQLTFF